MTTQQPWTEGFEELLERKARMVRYSVQGQAKRTSLNLERGFWEVLDREAALKGVTPDCFLSELIGKVLESSPRARVNLTSALRVWALSKERHRWDAGSVM